MANKVQIITDDDAEFVCRDCGEPLEEIKTEQAQKPKGKKTLGIAIVLGAILFIALIAGGIVLIVKNNQKEVEAARIAAIESARQDSIAKAEAAIAAEKQARLAAEELAARLAAEAEEEAARLAAEEATKKQNKQTAPSGGSVSYGKWSGAWKNGKPDGMGTMTYRESHLIDSRDPQHRIAAVGDYIIGEFSDGKLVQGIWYDKANNQKGSIIIGK